MHAVALLEAAANVKLVHGEASNDRTSCDDSARLPSIIPDTTVSIAGRLLSLRRQRLDFSGLTAGYCASKKPAYYRNVLFLLEGQTEFLLVRLRHRHGGRQPAGGVSGQLKAILPIRANAAPPQRKRLNDSRDKYTRYTRFFTIRRSETVKRGK